MMDELAIKALSEMLKSGSFWGTAFGLTAYGLFRIGRWASPRYDKWQDAKLRLVDALRETLDKQEGRLISIDGNLSEIKRLVVTEITAARAECLKERTEMRAEQADERRKWSDVVREIRSLKQDPESDHGQPSTDH